MAGKKQVKIFLTAVVAIVFLILVILAWRVFFYVPSSGLQVEGNSASQTLADANGRDGVKEDSKTKTDDGNSLDEIKQVSAIQKKAGAKSVDGIVAGSRHFRAVFESWQNKTASDFAITDLDGKDHRLSDYRGKDVMVIFWATWCMPCISEIPELKKLRNQIGEDKLAILAISSEEPSKVRKLVDMIKINYTVAAANTQSLPKPFSQVQAIPCAFFVRPDGTIKLATIGTLKLNDIRAILDAE